MGFYIVTSAWVLLVALTRLPQSQADAPPFKVITLDSPIRDTVWVGASDEVVFTTTDGGHLWRSMDGGMTWTDETASGKVPLDPLPPKNKAAILATYEQFKPNPGVQAITFSEDAPNRVFFRGGADYHYITEDFGDTYKVIKGPAGHLGFVTVRLHPTETSWMLVVARRWSCWSTKSAVKAMCADDLFLTKDFGYHWQNLTATAMGRVLSFVDFDWGWTKDPNAPQRKVYKKDTILAAVYENRAEVRKHLAEHGTGLVAGWDQYVDFVRSNDLFKSAHTKVVPCGNQFEIMGGQLFLAVASSCGSRKAAAAGTVRLKISSDYGVSFTDACFPVPLSERGYSVVEATPTAAFVNVDYALARQGAPFGDVFVSDSGLTLFTSSLPRNTRSKNGAVDFAAVQGLPGVYIANQLELPDDEVAARPGHSGGQPVGTVEEDFMAHTTTKISLNGGGRWTTLLAPERDSEGTSLDCRTEDGCSLHLHGATSWVGGSGFAFVYSHKTTPGLIIATGNVGQYLYQDSSVNTYLSRDGGQSWEEMKKGPHIYEFGDSGGVIVMAKHGQHGSTNQLLYTLDEGMSWDTLNFGDEMDILNVRVEPDNVGKTFIVQGLAKAEKEGAARKGVLVAVNFGVGYKEYKVCGPNDYEWWTPSGAHCLLGQKISFQRQYREAKCWNGDKYIQPKRTEKCLCQEDDFQCDFGMELVGNRCEKISGFRTSSCPVLAHKGYAYTASKKRLVAGDMCDTEKTVGISYGHYQAPTKGGLPSWVSLLLGLLGVLAVGAGVVSYLAYVGKLPDEILSRIPYFERLRYRNLRSNFQSLAQDFGLGGGDDDYEAEEMARRPSG